VLDPILAAGCSPPVVCSVSRRDPWRPLLAWRLPVLVACPDYACGVPQHLLLVCHGCLAFVICGRHKQGTRGLQALALECLSGLLALPVSGLSLGHADRQT
jgi:hypothetical protein